LTLLDVVKAGAVNMEGRGESAMATTVVRRAGGIVLLIVGILMIPLPGPGLPIVVAALAMLGVPLPDLSAWLPRWVYGRPPSPIATPTPV